MLALNLSLKGSGWIYVRPNTDTKDRFMRILSKIKRLPVIGFDRKKKCQITSIHYLDDLYNICRENNFTVYVTDYVDEYHERYKLKLESIQKARNNTSFESEYWTEDPDFKVAPYQAQAINACITSKRYLIGDDMGVGKTVELIGSMCKAFEWGYNKALICVLNKLKYQWKDEILKFTKFKEEEISIIDPYEKFKCPLKITKTLDLRSKNSPCKTCKRMEQCKDERHDPKVKWKRQLTSGRIVITNYEALDKMKDLILKEGFDFFGLDEVTKLKNHGTLMSKAAQKISANMPGHSMIIPMSGRFIENRLEEIYPALAIADKRLVGEWYNFKNRYLVLDIWNNVVGYKREKKIIKLIDNWMIRRPIETVWPDRPKLVEDTIICDMGEEQREFYEKARDGCLDKLQNDLQEKINMADIAPLLNYLIQICDTTQAIDPATDHSIKLEVMKEKIEEIPFRHKIIIFSFFAKKVIPIIAQQISDMKMGEVLTITGKTKHKDAEKIKKQFWEDKESRFLICSDSMGYGANLQCATYIMNFDLPWNPAKLDQRIARAFRRGQKESVTVYNFVTRNTIEDKILEKIGHKRQIFKKFIDNNSIGIKRSKFSLKDLVDLIRK